MTSSKKRQSQTGSVQSTDDLAHSLVKIEDSFQDLLMIITRGGFQRTSEICFLSFLPNGLGSILLNAQTVFCIILPSQLLCEICMLVPQSSEGRLNCSDREKKIWSTVAIMSLIVLFYRLIWHFRFGKVLGEGWTVALVILVMSFKLIHRWIFLYDCK